MSKYVITELDKQINEGRSICVDVALRRIQNYIIKYIDSTFSTNHFKEWCDSDTDKPFVWNKNRYYWDQK